MLGPPHLEVRRPSPTTVEFIVTTQPRRSGWTGWALAAAVVAVRVLLAASAGVVLWVWTSHREAATRGWLSASGGSGSGSSGSRSSKNTWQGLIWHLLAATHALDTLRTAAAAPPWLVLPLCAAALWASVARVHTSESLLVLRGLGIQTRSTGATYLGDLVSGLSVLWWTLTTPWTLLARFFSISGNTNGGTATSSAYDGYYGEPTPAATRFIPTEKLQDLLVNEAFLGFEVRYYLVAVVAGGGGGAGVGAGAGGEGLGGRVKSARLFEEGEEDGRGGEGVDQDDGKHREEECEDGEYDDEEGSEGPSDGSSSDEDEDNVVVVFPRLLPGLDIVRTVWREARACLYEPDGKGSS